MQERKIKVEIEITVKDGKIVVSCKGHAYICSLIMDVFGLPAEIAKDLGE